MRTMIPALFRASRYISWALRHAPADAAITLDIHGWTPVLDLLLSLKDHGHVISKSSLREIVADDAKGRYSFSDDGKLIRANYGHSVNVVLDAPATVPPAVLFHGTARRNLGLIQRDGLLPRTRRFVHLTDDLPAAFSIGRRHGPAVVLVIDAPVMHADGRLFYAMGRHIWLTETVPSSYLKFDALIFDDEELSLSE